MTVGNIDRISSNGGSTSLYPFIKKSELTISLGDTEIVFQLIVQQLISLQQYKLFPLMSINPRMSKQSYPMFSIKSAL